MRIKWTETHEQIMSQTNATIEDVREYPPMMKQMFIDVYLLPYVWEEGELKDAAEDIIALMF